MFQTDDMVIYGKMGVCKVKDITFMNIDGSDSEQLYYVLEPTNESYTIYSRVNNSKVYMRPIITETEACRLIDSICTIQGQAYFNDKVQDLTKHYQSVLDMYNCADLIKLTMSIQAKKKMLQQKNLKVGQTDARYLKQAEELLYSEFSCALGIPMDEVPDYIESKINAHPSPTNTES